MSFENIIPQGAAIGRDLTRKVGGIFGSRGVKEADRLFAVTDPIGKRALDKQEDAAKATAQQAATLKAESAASDAAFIDALSAASATPERSAETIPPAQLPRTQEVIALSTATTRERLLRQRGRGSTRTAGQLGSPNISQPSLGQRLG